MTPPASSPLADWAASQQPGSVIELAGTASPSPEFTEAVELGWRGLYVTTSPYGASEAARVFPVYQGRAFALCADIREDDNRIAAASPTLLVAGIHPSNLFPLWVEPDPPLPTPRLAVVTCPNAFRVLDILSQWARIDAFKLTVSTSDEAAIAGKWLGAGWIVLKTEDLTVWCRRA